MKSKFLKSIFIVIILFTTSSCQSAKNIDNGRKPNPVYITNTKQIHLLGPEKMVGKIDSAQLLSGAFGERSISFFVYLFSDENGIQIELLNDFGTDMGSAFYDGKTVAFNSSLFPQNLQIEYILCDIQNVYYDFESLAANYKKAGLIYEETVHGNEKIRRIFSGNNIVEEITILENSIKIQNYLRGYYYNLIEGEE